ncbi:LysR family substrate-binding domain-containing protein [Paraburkholderia sp. CNPSo 3076]|uniref:LysR family substrate-binding domain-containing protein n=1 Tax=Paraburkholderia sp. CNPSo 3076 TaxID=2940936 RepID=UPI00224C98E6|nr:LysR family substrate-binding domain-containing protein [Paraburkholderia sp. CNPSo 3076]MCX5541201.1 LysR family substrate-binding domain-containing protein [Paraburkholderia sp. CNPSo 3076]
MLAGRRASRGEVGKLCIAYASSVALEPELPALLRRFAQARPDVELELRAISVQAQMNALADERIDVAFLRSPGPQPASIRIPPFSRTQLDVVVSRDHRCANRRRLTLRDVAGERLIVMDDPPGVALGVVSFAPAGLGVGIVPRTLARFGLEGAVFKPLAMANEFSEVVIATRAYDRSAGTRALLEMVAQGRR